MNDKKSNILYSFIEKKWVMDSDTDEIGKKALELMNSRPEPKDGSYCWLVSTDGNLNRQKWGIFYLKQHFIEKRIFTNHLEAVVGQRLMYQTLDLEK